MPQFDLPLAELQTYRTATAPPADLRDFWERTISESRAKRTASTLEPVDTGMVLVETFDLTFSGFDGQPVRAWVHAPRHRTEPLPAIIEFQGYSHGRRMAWQNHHFAEAGYVHIVMDNRGQGWQSVSATPDTDPTAGSGTVPGLMTRGITSPETYYYRRLYTDAVMLVDAARELDLVAPDRVALSGISQGGGIAIATAALSDGVIAATIDVPFLCDFERAVTLTDVLPYSELVEYFGRYRDVISSSFRTLAYFDGAHLAELATVPTLFSVALRDYVCPPSTVYAAYNAWAGTEKEMHVYPFNGHEGGEEHHMLHRLQFFADVFQR